MNPLDRMHERIDCLFLQHHASGTQAHGLPMLRLVVYAGQHNHSRLFGRSTQLGQDVEAALIAQIEVKQNNVRLIVNGAQDGSVTVGCVANNTQPRLIFNQHAQPRAHNHVIVD